jgi:hypothetical protein
MFWCEHLFQAKEGIPYASTIGVPRCMCLCKSLVVHYPCGSPWWCILWCKSFVVQVLVRVPVGACTIVSPRGACTDVYTWL